MVISARLSKAVRTSAYSCTRYQYRIPRVPSATPLAPVGVTCNQECAGALAGFASTVFGTTTTQQWKLVPSPMPLDGWLTVYTVRTTGLVPFFSLVPPRGRLIAALDATRPASGPHQSTRERVYCQGCGSSSVMSSMQLAHFVCGASRPNKLSIFVWSVVSSKAKVGPLGTGTNPSATKPENGWQDGKASPHYWTCGRVPFIPPIFSAEDAWRGTMQTASPPEHGGDQKKTWNRSPSRRIGRSGLGG
jgi:hypothetical protein